MSFDRKAYDKAYFAKNKEKRYKQRRIRQVTIKNWFLDHKDTLKCEICGEDRFATLQFHHRDPAQKSGNVSEMVLRGFSIKRIESEIAKCDVLCANCHAVIEFDKRLAAAISV